MGTQHVNLHPAGDLFYSASVHRNHVLATANTGKIGRGFAKNAEGPLLHVGYCFSNAVNAFGLIISLQKTEELYQT